MAKFQGTGKVELMEEAHNNSEFDLITLRRQVKALPFTQAGGEKAEPQAVRLLPVLPLTCWGPTAPETYICSVRQYHLL